MVHGLDRSPATDDICMYGSHHTCICMFRSRTEVSTGKQALVLYDMMAIREIVCYDVAVGTVALSHTLSEHVRCTMFRCKLDASSHHPRRRHLSRTAEQVKVQKTGRVLYALTASALMLTSDVHASLHFCLRSLTIIQRKLKLCLQKCNQTQNHVT